MHPDNTSIQKLNRLENSFLSEVKDKKPLVGYLCLRTPVEIIEAYDAVPIRIVSEPGFEVKGQNLIRNDACSFCRSVPYILKSEPYKRISAIIAGSCCDQMRRLMDTIDMNGKLPTILYTAPRTWIKNKTFFLPEMEKAFSELGTILGTSLNAELLEQRVDWQDRLRAKINQLRAEERISGELFHHINRSPLPAERLLDFLEELPIMEDRSGSVRLMLFGSIPSGLEIQLIEEAGGEVVADATCLGDRTFIPVTSSNPDLIERLFEHYIEENLCPHRRPYTPLIDYVRDLADARDIDGIIYRTVKYCHPFGLSSERIKAELGLPFLHIDDDLTSAAIASLRTRITAFVEMLEARIAKQAVILE